MNRTLRRTLAGTALLSAVLPSALAAHAGHAGDHGFLYAALQPLLSADHLLAGLIVAGAGGAICAVAARVLGTSRRTRRS